jgi:hypothetical protein
MQARARNDLAKLMAEALAAAGLDHEGITAFSTPRRLALIVAGLPLATEAVSEEVKGPRSSAPPQALEGFLRKTGLKQDQLEERDGVWFARIDKPGRATAEVLAEAVAAIVRDGGAVAYLVPCPWPLLSAATAEEQIVIEFVIRGRSIAVKYGGGCALQPDDNCRVVLISPNMPSQTVSLPAKVVSPIKRPADIVPVTLAFLLHVCVGCHVGHAEDGVLVCHIWGGYLIHSPG